MKIKKASNHILGNSLGLMMPHEVTALKTLYLDRRISEKAKFIYQVFQTCIAVEKKEEYWFFRIDALFNWFDDIFSQQEVFEAFEELKKANYILFDINDALRAWEEFENKEEVGC